MAKQLRLLVIYFLIKSCFSMPASAQGTSSDPLQRGLVAWYPLNETAGTVASDASSSGRSAQIVNGGNWHQWGRLGGCIRLNNGAALQIPLQWQPKTFTVSWWVYADEGTIQNFTQAVGANLNDSWQWGSFMFHASATGKIYIGTNLETCLETAGDLEINRLIANKWQHFVFTYNQGEGALYKDGVRIAYRGSGMSMPAAWKNLAFGSTVDTRLWAAGYYDDIRVYNRALGAQEVTQLFQGTPAAPTGSAATANWFPKEISVDQFTGTAQVSIPLFQVAEKGISVPVGLSYSATGVQVDDNGGVVGVNWSLQAGASVRRLVRGLPDDIQQLNAPEIRYGWLRYPAGDNPGAHINLVPDASSTINATGCATSEQTAFLQLEKSGLLKRGVSGVTNYAMYDTEPDVFFYSLPGHSGRFVFDASGKVRTIPYDPITVTFDPLDASGIPSFTIRTPEGHTYLFDQTERSDRKSVTTSTTPKYFLQDYFRYKLPQTNTTYIDTWNASRITTPAGGRVELEYLHESTGYDYPADKSTRHLLQGTSVTPAGYSTEVRQLSRLWLQKIKSSTTAVTFDLVRRDGRQYFVESISLTSLLNQNALIKRYQLAYISPPNIAPAGHKWTAEKGGPLFAEEDSRRMYLSSVQASNGCTNEPVYQFTYDQTTPTGSPLPPPGAVNQDYWGYYNANNATTLIPRLFVYPQLLASQPLRPAAPYRLYEAASYAAGGFALEGADRRPAVNFTAALAGTLTQITFAGGGKALLDYDAHQFYDPVANQSYPAGGTRIRTIRVQEPVTKVELRKSYTYQEDNGQASGALLHAPRFAFTVPSSGATPQEQWTNATVRSGEDLLQDPFETRAIGYRQVTEKLPERGEVVTVFHVAGSADEGYVAATNGVPNWQRPFMGVARQLINGSICATVAPLQGGTELYPLSIAPNDNFRRGLPQSILYKAEPVGTAASMIVQQRNFVYEYRRVSTLPAVVGLSYEQLGTPTDAAYAYSKYSLLTDFLYTVRQQTVLNPNPAGVPTQSITAYRYNDKGWLAAVATQNSDRGYVRTRYKYLSDYSFSSSSSDPKMQALVQRVTSAEQISSDVVETISEIVSPTHQVRFTGATLNTFSLRKPSINPLSWLSQPHQTWRWQPAQALAS